MGQTNAKRVQFQPRETILNPKNDDIQDLAFTGYLQVGDTVDVIDVDAVGNIISVISDNLTILAIDPNASVVLSAAVDTTTATVTPQLRVQSIDDAQQAIDRLYRKKISSDIEFILRQNITAQKLNSPTAGKTTYDIDDASLWRAGDLVDILADEGVIQTGVTIDSVSPNADATNNSATIVIVGVHDTSTFTNPFLLNKTITVQKAILRNQERIDGVDQPLENEFVGIGDAKLTVFESTILFVEGSSKLLLDGRRLRLGVKGTLATLVQGTGNSQLTFNSMVLGLDGNKTKIEVQAGAGLTVSVTGNFNSGHTITVNDNGGVATSQEIADAINSDATARRLILVQFGGTGAGTVAVFGPTSLAGGLNDGTGDYAELEQIFENLISSTGFKWVSLHIRTNERNRLNSPPDDDEELVIDYRKASDNVDR